MEFVKSMFDNLPFEQKLLTKVEPYEKREE
jgi:hypothetical protein